MKKEHVKGFGKFVNEQFNLDTTPDSEDFLGLSSGDKNPNSNHNYDPRSYELSVDMGYPDSSNDFMDVLHDICNEYMLQIVKFIPKGKAGGTPNITFRGSITHLKQMLVDNGYEDVEWMMSRAKPIEMK